MYLFAICGIYPVSAYPWFANNILKGNDPMKWEGSFAIIRFDELLIISPKTPSISMRICAVVHISNAFPVIIISLPMYSIEKYY